MTAKSGSTHGTPVASFTCTAAAFSDKGLAVKLTAKNTVGVATAVTDVVTGIVAAVPNASQTSVAVAVS